MTVWSLGTLLYVLLLGDIPYETTDHIIHNKPKKVLLIPYSQFWKTHPNMFPKYQFSRKLIHENFMSTVLRVPFQFLYKIGSKAGLISGKRIHIW